MVHRAATNLALAAILSAWLVRAETGQWEGAAKWRRTKVAGSTAYGPYQLTKTTATDIATRRVWHGITTWRYRIGARARKDLLELYERVGGLEPGQIYHPSDAEQAAYLDACTSHWVYLRRRVGRYGPEWRDDPELTAWLWRYGENKPAQFKTIELFLRWARDNDPRWADEIRKAL
jgi:hypothetical protein